MNHGRIRELLALELYGELDATETGELRAHLSSCADCRHFAIELRNGLGAMSGAPAWSRPSSLSTRLSSPSIGAAGTAAAQDDLPAGWREALRDSVSELAAQIRWTGSGRDQTRLSPPLQALIGFAAGVLFALLFQLGPKRGGIGPEAEAAAGSAVTFEREGPPPRATTSGRLSRAAWLSRG